MQRDAMLVAVALDASRVGRLEARMVLDLVDSGDEGCDTEVVRQSEQVNDEVDHVSGFDEGGGEVQ